MTGYRSETDPRELALYQQIRIGQRVIARVKKSEFDLEPQNLTGIVKYVGTIDSEYVDNRLYVGVKLDEAGKLFSVSFFPSGLYMYVYIHSFLATLHSYVNGSAVFFTVGNTDGIIKGKRYFSCPSKHGKVVRINDIVAVLPRKVGGIFEAFRLHSMYV